MTLGAVQRFGAAITMTADAYRTHEFDRPAALRRPVHLGLRGPAAVFSRRWRPQPIRLLGLVRRVPVLRRGLLAGVAATQPALAQPASPVVVAGDERGPGGTQPLQRLGPRRHPAAGQRRRAALADLPEPG